MENTDRDPRRDGYAAFRSVRQYGDGAEPPQTDQGENIPAEYAAELRAQFPSVTEAGIASFWRARHLPTD